MAFDLDPTQTLLTSLLVLYLGSFVIARVPFLRNNDIPVPVVGGLIFAALTSALYLGADLRVSFDMDLKGPMMLAFFATIGLGADMRMLAQGGPQLLIFGLICGAYLVIQNGIGMTVAMGLDLHPLVGLLGSSITLSGGHGTGAAYAASFADTRNLAGAMELAMACATFGLIIGGLLGGPIAGRLIRKHGLEPTAPAESPAVDDYEAVGSHIGSESLLLTLLYVVICLVVGAALANASQGLVFTLPGFVWSLLVGVAIRNLTGAIAPLRVHAPTVEALGGIALSLFLSMALISLRLWEILGLAGPLLVLIGVQTVGLALFASFVTFRFMGRHYDAAIIAGGHCGFGLGATPTAVANMQALTRRFGTSPQAFIVVPLMGAFFIDILNAIVIQGFLALPIFGN
jgi:ESS family glutamate:Na+ symporter